MKKSMKWLVVAVALAFPFLAGAQTPPQAFQQTGLTQPFTANISGSIPTPVQVTSTNTVFTQYVVTNGGSNTAYISHAPTSGAATTNCVVPPSLTYVVLPFAQIVITDVPNAFFCGITDSGTSAIKVTPGSGM